jgi:hypothetical protein
MLVGTIVINNSNRARALRQPQWSP